MGAGQLVEVDVHAHTVVRTLGDLPDVHGVIVVPDKHRVYATATGRNQMVAIDEDSGAVVFTAPTDAYPDGLAYDPIRNTVWTTNEHAGSETVIDADTGSVHATVPFGGQVGNVVYDPTTDRMVVAVQGRNELAVIDPVSFAVTDRIPTPGCDHPHGQTLDAAAQVMFVGCANNATVGSVDLPGRAVTISTSVRLPMCWFTTRAHTVCMWPAKAAGSASSSTAAGTSPRAEPRSWPTERTRSPWTPQPTTATSRSPMAAAEAPCCGNSNQPAKNPPATKRRCTCSARRSAVLACHRYRRRCGRFKW
jgi:hypothetical protein